MAVRTRTQGEPRQGPSTGARPASSRSADGHGRRLVGGAARHVRGAEDRAADTAGGLTPKLIRLVAGHRGGVLGPLEAGRTVATPKGPRQDRAARPLRPVRHRSQPQPTQSPLLRASQRDFLRATTALSLYAFSLAYPPLLIAAVLVAATVVLKSIKQSAINYYKTRTFTIYTLFMLNNIGLIVFGWWGTFCILSAVITGSRYLLLKTEDHSNRAMVGHFREIPNQAWVRVDGAEVRVPLARIAIGDHVVVRAGEIVPIDGVVVEGVCEVDESALTGESLPVARKPGDTVLSSTLMVQGWVVVRVEHSGKDTAAAQVMEALQKTADYKLTIQTRGEAHANAWAFPMFLAGLVAAPFVGPLGMMAVWVSIPGLNYRVVAPFAMLRTLSEAQAAQILIKDGRVLEALHEIDTVVFDKTGTLTEERLGITDIRFEPGWDADLLWRLIAAAEHRQSHPIARALLDAAQEAGAEDRPPDWANVTVGAGVRAHLDDHEIAIGNTELMERAGIGSPPAHTEALPGGATAVHVAVDGRYAGHLVVQARLRAEAAEVVATLNAWGFRTAIISGDTDAVTREVAADLGVHAYHAGVLPHQKAALIRSMQATGRRVCFVGDGVNDAVALRQANVSVSMRGATTIAIDTAHMVLLAPDLRLVANALGMIRRYDWRMRWSKWMVMSPAAISWSAVLLAGTGPLFTMMVSQTFLWTTIALIARTAVFETETGTAVETGAGAGAGADAPVDRIAHAGAARPQHSGTADAALATRDRPLRLERARNRRMVKGRSRDGHRGARWLV